MRLDVTVRGPTASIAAFADYLPVRLRDDHEHEPPLESCDIPDLP